MGKLYQQLVKSFFIAFLFHSLKNILLQIHYDFTSTLFLMFIADAYGIYEPKAC